MHYLISEITLTGIIIWTTQNDTHRTQQQKNEQHAFIHVRNKKKIWKEFESISSVNWSAEQKANFLKTNHLILSYSAAICIHIQEREQKAIISFIFCRQIMNTLLWHPPIPAEEGKKKQCETYDNFAIFISVFITFESCVQIDAVKKFTIDTWIQWIMNVWVCAAVAVAAAAKKSFCRIFHHNNGHRNKENDGHMINGRWL